MVVKVSYQNFLMPLKLSNVQKNALERYFTIDKEVIQDNTRIAV